MIGAQWAQNALGPPSGHGIAVAKDPTVRCRVPLLPPSTPCTTAGTDKKPRRRGGLMISTKVKARCMNSMETVTFLICTLWPTSRISLRWFALCSNFWMRDLKLKSRLCARGMSESWSKRDEHHEPASLPIKHAPALNPILLVYPADTKQ